MTNESARNSRFLFAHLKLRVLSLVQTMIGFGNREVAWSVRTPLKTGYVPTTCLLNPPHLLHITHLRRENCNSLTYSWAGCQMLCERRSQKGQGLPQKEGPPTYAILSRNLVLSQFMRFLNGFHRALNKSHPAFKELSTKVILLSLSFQWKSSWSCFRRAFNKSHPAFVELSTEAKNNQYLRNCKRRRFCRENLQLCALRKLWGIILRSPKGRQLLPPWSKSLKDSNKFVQH